MLFSEQAPNYIFTHEPLKISATKWAFGAFATRCDISSALSLFVAVEIKLVTALFRPHHFSFEKINILVDLSGVSAF
jgi:hypothetical protein